MSFWRVLISAGLFILAGCGILRRRRIFRDLFLLVVLRNRIAQHRIGPRLGRTFYLGRDGFERNWVGRVRRLSWCCGSRGLRRTRRAFCSVSSFGQIAEPVPLPFCFRSSRYSLRQDLRLIAEFIILIARHGIFTLVSENRFRRHDCIPREQLQTGRVIRRHALSPTPAIRLKRIVDFPIGFVAVVTPAKMRIAALINVPGGMVAHAFLLIAVVCAVAVAITISAG